MTAIEIVLFVALTIAVVGLIVILARTARALGEVSASLKTLSDDLHREGLPLLREARRAAEAATETMESVRAAAGEAARVGPLLEEARPVVARAADLVSHADEAISDTRVTLGTAQRTLGQAESILTEFRLSEIAVQLLKNKASDVGHLAANVGQLVKSVWHRRGGKADEEPSKGG